MTTNERQKRFLTAYRRTGKVAPAAREAGVHRDTVYAWRKADPVFSQAMADIDAQRHQKQQAQRQEYERISRFYKSDDERRRFHAGLRRLLLAEG